MGLWGLGRAFSVHPFLKIFIFSTENGRFSAGGANLPPPIGNRVKEGRGVWQKWAKKGRFLKLNLIKVGVKLLIMISWE